jgi:hypothetical protein
VRWANACGLGKTWGVLTSFARDQPPGFSLAVNVENHVTSLLFFGSLPILAGCDLPPMNADQNAIIGQMIQNNQWQAQQQNNLYRQMQASQPPSYTPSAPRNCITNYVGASASTYCN